MGVHMNKNDVIKLNIAGLTSEGHGVGKVYEENGEAGFAIFVPGTLPGEEVEIVLTKVLKNYAFGKLLTVMNPSPDRVNPPCKVAASCGGCTLQHLRYSAQLVAKRQMVVDNLQRIGHFGESEEEFGFSVEPTIGMEDPWRYRNKSQMPFRVSKEGRIENGFYRAGSHDIVPTTECLIQDFVADRVVGIVREFSERERLSVYNEKTGKGLLRHVMTRVGKRTGEVMVVFVLNGTEFEKEDELVEALRLGLSDDSRTSMFTLSSVALNTNTKATNVILGKKTRILFGKDFITDRIGKYTFKISPLSFFQVNTAQTSILYEKAMEFADLSGSETVIDAYCGAGTISLFLSNKAKKVIGVEVVEPAVRDAIENAKRNEVSNVEFIAGEAEVIIPSLFRAGTKADVILVDPPRKGCDLGLLETLLAMKPKKIVYVSCDPATFSRDLRILVDGGYSLKKVQPVDMFPMTSGIENVGLLELA